MYCCVKDNFDQIKIYECGTKNDPDDCFNYSFGNRIFDSKYGIRDDGDAFVCINKKCANYMRKLTQTCKLKPECRKMYGAEVNKGI